MSEFGVAPLSREEVQAFMEELPAPDLPSNSLARIDVVTDEDGDIKVMVNLREGMDGREFAEMLYSIANQFMQGTAKQVE